MNVRLLAVPYDSALRCVRMGAGPGHLLSAGLSEQLQAAGHSVSVEQIEPDSRRPPTEIRTAFELIGLIAERVRSVQSEGWFPVVLAGNCNTAVGTLAGLAAARPAIVWFDAHGDFNTPETTTTGFLDGMALAIATGRCWTELTARVPGFQPVPERRVVLLGARALDPLERAALAGSEVTVLAPDHLGADLEEALQRLRSHTHEVYVHVDLDVLDPEEGRANEFAAPGGLHLDELRRIVRRIARDFRIRSLALTAYDPAYDTDGRICRAAFILLHTALTSVAPVLTGRGDR